MIFNDVWLLSLVGKVWQWREVNVLNREWSATYMWCHQACRVSKLSEFHINVKDTVFIWW